MTPLRVGLTGGVASGKSTVAGAFGKLGVPVFSADAIAHELTAPGTVQMQAIRQCFGDSVLQADGGLDRAVLAEIVFADPEARSALEGILHPPIRAALKAQVDSCDAAYCILEIPLLRQSDVGSTVDRVLVVDLDEDTQLRRLQARDGRDPALAARMLAAQASRESRLSWADDILDNSVDGADLAPAVAALDALYRDIASRGDPGRPGLRLRVD